MKTKEIGPTWGCVPCVALHAPLFYSVSLFYATVSSVLEQAQVFSHFIKFENFQLPFRLYIECSQTGTRICFYYDCSVGTTKVAQLQLVHTASHPTNCNNRMSYDRSYIMYEVSIRATFSV